MSKPDGIDTFYEDDEELIEDSSFDSYLNLDNTDASFKMEVP